MSLMLSSIRTIRNNLPLAVLGAAFIALAFATQCSSESVGSKAADDPMDASQPGVDDSGAPMIACFNDIQCPLPPSTCENGNTLVYWTRGICVDQKCQFERARQACSNCMAGGCLGTTTASGVPIFMSDGQAGAAGNGGVSDATIDHATIAPPEDAGRCIDQDASTCVLPASICADELWLAYFTDGQCQEGHCHWRVAYRECGGRGCQDGACVQNFTIK
jgi:hypothetical protein